MLNEKQKEALREVGFISNPDLWPSDKMARLVEIWTGTGEYDAVAYMSVIKEIYDIEERYAKIVWMERQTNAILKQLKESGVTIPLDMLERLPAFRPDNPNSEQVIEA